MTQGTIVQSKGGDKGHTGYRQLTQTQLVGAGKTPTKIQNAWRKKKEYEEAKTGGGGRLEDSKKIPG